MESTKKSGGRATDSVAVPAVWAGQPCGYQVRHRSSPFLRCCCSTPDFLVLSYFFAIHVSSSFPINASASENVMGYGTGLFGAKILCRALGPVLTVGSFTPTANLSISSSVQYPQTAP